jgi:predicted DCC family thiol-disulfide oxidoreductase YuxK
VVTTSANIVGWASAEAEPPALVYDGQCPFCSAYVRMVRLRRAFGELRLVDARSGDPVVAELRAAGLDLDRGMVLKVSGHLYAGDQCLHVLALMSTSSDLFNRITGSLFRSPHLARWAYPVLVAGRNATLFLLGRRKLNAPS